MDKILKNVFLSTDLLKNYETKLIGKVIYIKLDDNRNVELRFCTTRIADKYDSLQLKVSHKQNGVLHSQAFHFIDLFEKASDDRNLSKHIWFYRGEYSWYGKMDKRDFEVLRDTVRDFLAIWE